MMLVDVSKKLIKPLFCLSAAFLLFSLAHKAFARDTPLRLTEAERTFIQEHPTIRVGIDPNFAPFEILDGQGNYDGIAADYLKLISAKTGLIFEPAKDVSYADAQEMVAAHELDLLPTLGWTAEREARFLLSKLYYEYKLAFVTREDAAFNTVEDFRGQIIAVQESTAPADFASSLNASLSLYEAEEDAVLAVASGKDAVALGHLPIILYSARTLGLSNLKYITFESDQTNGFHMGTRDDWPELRGILNKAIDAITPAERAEIQSRWINVDNSQEYRTLLRWVGVFAAFLLAIFVFIAFKMYSNRKKIAEHLRNEILLQEKVEQQTMELREQTRVAVEASRAKSDFLAKMSHEIRTPMNVVVGLAEVVSRCALPADVKANVWDIKQAGQHLLSIINDILDFSKIEAGKMDLADEAYMLGSMLHDVENIIRFRISETPLAFAVKADPGLPCALRGDMTRIRQILLNLLGNAVKFTPEGSVTLTVSGALRAEDEILLSFEVADTGSGIREEDIEKIFDNFSQIDSPKNRNAEGTGLGLAISQNLCRMMGGGITVQSVYGEGSVFTAVIPQKVADARPLTEYRETAGYNSESRSARFVAPDARILAVDDSETNLSVLRGLLSPLRARLDSCLSGEDAIALVRQNQYDLIFMDHMMPGMDGIETTKALRELEGGDAVPIVALTANVITGMREIFLENGFTDFLSKPIEISKLNKIMAKWIPFEKRRDAAREERRANGGTPRPTELEAGFAVEGLDIARGLAMSCGSVRQYKDVLSVFCRETGERLPMLRELLDPAGLPLFTTYVHALKSSLASIGASALSEEAEILENAGKASDAGFIQENAPAFFTQLSALVACVQRALENDLKVRAGRLGFTKPDWEMLTRLREALAATDVRLADQCLNTLYETAYDPGTEKILSDISDNILTADFAEAIRAADALLDETRGR
ncbi:MAG: transporter substrate-binding domain-containing protein [Clostridiales bacterium]|jgi:signal transduction histidine kinase/FixJ family two-component response regulator/HPt (histidine-containing phosphotransfer) domain-containing protein|nr:transporter substrate-binding domain-containing protein [Clostridiales bacterium]